MLKKSTLYISIVLCFILILSYTALGKWEKSRNDDLYGYLRGIYFIDEKTGWAVGDDGVITVTDDSGTTHTYYRTILEAGTYHDYYQYQFN